MSLSQRSFSTLFAVGVAAISFTMVGCDSGPKKVGVTGTVNFNGKPLKDGTIQFDPVETTGQPGAASITDGAFTLPAERGLLAGEYKVRISANVGEDDPIAEDQAPGESGPLRKQPIPTMYNSETTLTETVSSDKENVFTFDLKAK